MLDVCESRILFDGTPTAAFNPIPTVTTAATFVDFTVTYTDDVGVDPATLGVGPDPQSITSPPDLIVRGPGGFAAIASYQAPDTPPAVSPSLTATYRIPAPNGRFNAFATGTYTVSVRPNAVTDGDGNVVPEADIGTFDVDVPAVTGGDLAAGSDTDLQVRAVAVQPNGKILVVGDEDYARAGVVADGEDANQVYVHTRGVIRRYNADGSIDTSFGGGDGRVELQPDTDTFAEAVAVRNDGSIYVAGGTGVADVGGTNFTLTRLTSTGTVDSTFGAGGVATVNFDPGVTGQDLADAIAFQSTGRIVLGGQTTTVPVDDPVVRFGLVRLNADGSVDNTFGTAGNGMIVTGLADGGAAGVGRLVVGPSDEVVVAGGDGGNGVEVDRFSADGDVDTSFGGGDGRFVVPGLVTPGAGSAGDPLVGLVELPDGRLLVAAAPATGTGAALVRLRAADGSVDTGFGTGGVATASFGAGDADAVLVLPSNKYLVLGTDKAAGNVATALAAFNADGTPATAFGTNGRTLIDTLPASSAVAAATVAVTLDQNGNVLVTRVTDTGASRLRLLAGDFTPPVATLTPVPDVTTSGGANVTLTVTYTDDSAVNAADITNNANTTITVAGPAGTVAVVLASVDSTTNGTQRVATYTFAAPGGSFDMGDNGTYTVAIAASQVRDTSGNPIPAATLGTFHVNIPAPGAPTAAPTPVADVTTAGATSLNFTVTYTDPDGTIDTTTIGPSDVTVATAGGTPLAVTNVAVSGSGSTVAVTYTATPPGGSWDSADNGTYVISVAGNEVKDNTGLFVPAAALGSFVVDVPAPGGDLGTPLGDFGAVSGKNKSLTFTANGTRVTLSIKGGTGHATMKDGRVVLVLDGTTAKSAVTIKTKGGNGRLTLGDVTASGSLRSFTATTADLAGTFTVNGDGGKMALGGVTGAISATGAIPSLDVRGALGGTVTTGASLTKLTVRGDLTANLDVTGGVAALDARGNMAGILTAGGAVGKVTVRGATTGRIAATSGIPKLDLRGPVSGTITAGGRIGTLSVRGDLTGTVTAADGFGTVSVRGNVSGARVLAGADLGSDGQLGGTGGAADQFSVGAIAKVTVTGAVNGPTVIAAGLDPVNGVFLDGDDRVVNSAQSTIGSVAVKGGVTDPARFVAGKFGKVRAPGAVVPGTDPRFVVL